MNCICGHDHDDHSDILETCTFFNDIGHQCTCRKNKIDAVISCAAQLEAERDELRRQLEQAQSDLATYNKILDVVFEANRVQQP